MPISPSVRVASAALLLLAGALPAQDKAGTRTPKAPKAPKADTVYKGSALFSSDSLVAVTFTLNMKQIRGDRSQTVPWRAATMSYTAADGKTVTVPMRAKTHGVWRLKNCDFPPIRLNIADKDAKGTLFQNAEKPKFVNVCRNNDRYEQLVLKEMQLYRVYQAITPRSHKVRVLRVTYVDSASGKVEATRYGFVFEDPDEMAKRLGGVMIKTKGAGPDDLEPAQGAIAYLFEYMIGNTDFSFNGLHNGELVSQEDGTILSVAYDFDFSGAVNAPYATVDPKLSVKRVRDRLFRGYCAFAPQYPAAVTLFHERKPAIYALYGDETGRLMEPDIAKESLEYFDDFYAEIKDLRSAEQNVYKNCLGAR